MSALEPITRKNLAEHLQQAYRLREQKDFEKAFLLAGRCVAEFGQDSEVLCLWSLVKLDKKAYQEAETAIHTAIALDPKNSHYYNVLGQIHIARQQYVAAERTFLQSIKQDPTHIQAYIYLATLYELQKRYPEALYYFKQVIALNSESAIAYFHLGLIYHLQRKLNEALANYEQAERLMPNNVVLLNNMGMALAMDQQREKALEYYQRAIDLVPHYIPAITNLASTYIEMHQYQQAEDILRPALSIAPRTPANWRYLTLCRHYEFLNDPDLVKILELAEEKISPEDKIQYHFALGKIYHDCKDYKMAFANYQKGNQLQAKKITYDANAFANDIQQIIMTSQKLLVTDFPSLPHESAQPLLILGPPCSGKSLLEFLLQQHPQIASRGEIGIANRVDSLSSDDQPLEEFPFWLGNLTSAQANALQAAYYQHLKRDNISAVDYFIDTMSENALYLGLLKTLFPKMKIIYCQRNPLDMGVLLYFRYFTEGHSYSYDMKNIASYYQQYTFLMQHWLKVYEDSIFAVEYNQLMQDPEHTLSTIFSFLECEPCASIDYKAVQANEVYIYQYYKQFFAPLEQELNAKISIVISPEIEKSSRNSMMKKASSAFKQGDMDFAQKICQKILATDANDDAAWHLSGLIYLRQEQVELAISQFTTALQYSPDNPQYHLDLAKALQKAGKPLEAKQQRELAEKHRTNIENTDLKLDDTMRTQLLSAFQQPPQMLAEVERNLLVATSTPSSITTDSLILQASEPSVDDRSVRSYRQAEDQDGLGAKAWHALYKNLAIIEELFKQAQSTMTILDIGCATGYFRRLLEDNYRNTDRKNFYYWGLDFREDALNTALKTVNNQIPSAFVLHDVKNDLPFVNSFFDYIVNLEIIQYLPIEVGQLLLSEMYRVLKPGGHLAIATTYHAVQPGFMQSVPYEQFTRMLRTQGFEILQQRGSHAKLQTLLKQIKVDHIPLVKALLTVHPPEIVSAMIAPLYPAFTKQITYICKIR